MADSLVIETIPELRDALSQIRRAGKSIGLVPTMGALHAGHGRLIEQAVEECDCVVVSVFVNPIQFDRQDDYDLYPRTLSDDVRFSERLGAGIVFAPAAGQMYPHPQNAFVEVEKVSEHLCGAFRPGHFRGVATVVLKLFNIVQPDRAYFGEKDAQQLAVIRRMVRDLAAPVTIVGVATVRESDGLALSSRNRRLTTEQRRIAPALYQALNRAAECIARGAPPDEAKRAALALVGQYPEMRVEYLEIVDPGDMQPVDVVTGPVRIAAAVWLGGVRLIDNVLWEA
jgi:pantoate--beta-alanine ligase